MKTGFKASTLDPLEEEEETEEKGDEQKKKTWFQDENPEAGNEDSHYNEFLAWMGKGPGKGNKGPGGETKGKGFQGNCLYCGVLGHRVNECRKKDSEMAEKGDGMGKSGPAGQGWSPTYQNNGKRERIPGQKRKREMQKPKGKTEKDGISFAI